MSDFDGNQTIARSDYGGMEAKVAERESPLLIAEKQLAETAALLDMVVTRYHERLEPLTGQGTPYPDGSEKGTDVDPRSAHIRNLAGLNTAFRESTARLERLLDRVEV